VRLAAAAPLHRPPWSGAVSCVGGALGRRSYLQPRRPWTAERLAAAAQFAALVDKSRRGEGEWTRKKKEERVEEVNR
jgi:hypothetical protein